MTIKDTKMLWGNAGGICTMPDCNIKLCEETTEGSKFPIGEQAHIIAEENDGPRGVSTLTKEERNSYYNMILLCPTCHSKIDKNTIDYPIEKLYMIKTKHEEYVRNTLTAKFDRQKQAEDEFYYDLTESIVTLLNLSQWNVIASNAFASDPAIPEFFYKGSSEFYHKLKLTAWTRKRPELEAAIFKLGMDCRKFLSEFTNHSESDGEFIKSIKYYRIPEWNEVEYQKLLKSYTDWIFLCDNLFVELTKSLNWFAEIVRRDINPLFFHINGKFSNPHDDLEESRLKYDYSKQQKQELVEKWFTDTI